MLLEQYPLPTQSAASNNVRVVLSNTAVSWLLLEIEEIGVRRFPAIALDPTTPTNLTLHGGTYRFWFYFQNLGSAASLTLQVLTTSSQSPFPGSPKTVTAAQAAHGQTSTKVVV